MLSEQNKVKDGTVWDAIHAQNPLPSNQYVIDRLELLQAMDGIPMLFNKKIYLKKKIKMKQAVDADQSSEASLQH